MTEPTENSLPMCDIVGLPEFANGSQDIASVRSVAVGTHSSGPYQFNESEIAELNMGPSLAVVVAGDPSDTGLLEAAFRDGAAARVSC